MRILHLTDLHATVPNQLDTYWVGVPALLRSPVDFVIVSGDIANAARAEEYDAALAFLENRVLPILPDENRSRVVIVPGNHDIDWTASLGPTISRWTNPGGFKR